MPTQEQKYQGLITQLEDINDEYMKTVETFADTRNTFDAKHKEMFPKKRLGKTRFYKPSVKGDKTLEPPKAEAQKAIKAHATYRSSYKTLLTRIKNADDKDPTLKEKMSTPTYLGLNNALKLDTLLDDIQIVEQKIQDEAVSGGMNPQGEVIPLVDSAEVGDPITRAEAQKRKKEAQKRKKSEQKRRKEATKAKGEGASAEQGVAPDDGGILMNDGKDAKDDKTIPILQLDPISQTGSAGLGIGTGSGGNLDAQQNGISIVIDGNANQELNNEFALPPTNQAEGAQVVPLTSTAVLTDTKGEPKPVNRANGGATQAENIDDDAWTEQLTLNPLELGMEAVAKVDYPELATNPYELPAETTIKREEYFNDLREQIAEAEAPELKNVMGDMEYKPQREDSTIENELVSRESLEGGSMSVMTADKVMGSNATKLNMEQLKLGIKTFHSLYDGVIPAFSSSAHQAGKVKALKSTDIKTVREHFLKMEMLVKAYFSSLGGDLSVGVIISASEYFKSFGKEALGFGKADNPVWNSREPIASKDRPPDDNMDIVNEVRAEDVRPDDPTDPKKQNVGVGRRDDTRAAKRLLREAPMQGRRRLGSQGEGGMGERLKADDLPEVKPAIRPNHEKWSKHENQFITDLKGADPYSKRATTRNILTRQGGVKHRYSEPISGKEIKAYTINTGMGYINDPTLHQDVRQPVYLPQPVIQRNPPQFVING